MATAPDEVIEALDASARANKRAEAANREAAQKARQAHDELLEFFRAAGIPVEQGGRRD